MALTDFQSANGGSGAFQFGNGGGFSATGTVVAPPNPTAPVSGSQITNGSSLNFPPSPPQDNGAGLVAGAIGGVQMPPAPATPSSTPALDSASIGQTGDFSQDPNYKAAQTGLSQSQSDYTTAVSNAPTASSIMDNTRTQYGLPDKLTALNNANADLAAVKAKYDTASQQQETQGIASGTPSVYYQGAQAAIQRQRAVDVGAKATIQAAAQGNYDRAESLAKEAADLKYKDIQDQLDRKAAFVKMNQDNLNSAEAKAISKIAAQQKQDQIKLDNQKQVFTWKLTYPNANIGENDTMAQAAQKASAWIAQNPYAGQKPTVIGSHYDDYGNKVDTYGLIGANGQIKPLDYSSSSGNINFGMSTGSILGLPSYNTAENNPGISRPVRNNNPGNIKATATSINYPGVVGVESTPAADGGNFLIFSDPQAGMNAVGNLLQSNIYKGMKAGDAIKKYNGGGAYGASDLGLDPNQDLQAQLQNPNTLQRVTQALATREGFSTNAQQPGAIGTTGSPTIDTSNPGYSTAIVGKTGLTQATIDQNALAYALGDKSGVASRTGKGQPQLQRTAIMNRASEINSSGNFAANKEQLKALSSSLTEQTKYLNTIDRSLTNAEDGFKQITDSFSKSGINPSESKFANTKINDVNNLFGKNQEALRAFQAGLYEVQNEYSQVFSRGGQRTLEGNKEAQDLLSGNLSLKDLMAVQKELQAQGDIVKNGSQAQVQKIQDQINNIINPGTKNVSTGQSAPPNTTLMTWTDGKQYYVPNDKLDAARQNGWK